MPTDDTPLGRVKAAIAGKPAKAYARVRPADVVELSKAVPDGKATQVILELAQGAAGAIAEYPAARAEQIESFQLAGQLAELVAAVEHPE